MGICVVGMGECGTTSVNKQRQVTSTLNQTLTELANNVSSGQNIQTKTLQNAKVKLGNIFIGPKCDNATIGNINQTSNVSQKISVNFDLSSSQSLAAQVSQAVQAAVKNDQTQKQGVFTTASTDLNNDLTVESYLTNSISTKISSNVVNELKNVLENAQNGDFSGGDIICNAPGLSIGNIVQQMTVQQMVDIILKSILGSEAVSDLKSTSGVDVFNKSKQENSGLTGFISALFSGLSKLVGSAGLAIFLLAFAPCILITVCVCACALLGGRGGGGGGSGKKTNASTVPAPNTAKPGFGKT